LWCCGVPNSGRGVRASYRLQLHPGFTLDDAAGVVAYLEQLGISHVYCSPYLRSTPGSTHGYDVIDHTQIDEELGGPEALARFCNVLAQHGMSHILDVVPNHMAVAGRANFAWWDVLQHGCDGRYARFFDIDWDPPEERLRGKVLLPILGDRYGVVLDAGDLVLLELDGDVVVSYYEHSFPLAPGSLEQLLGPEPSIERVNSEPALLHTLLERQYYRLAYWRTDLELNYRRFFDINDLVALRMEEPEVFAHVHQVPFELVRAGKLDGLRIDHVDGLGAPNRYLGDVRAEIGDAYLIVEKITEGDESIPDEWPVDGTTGYDFLSLVGGLFVDGRSGKDITSLYEEVIGAPEDLDDLAWDAKHQVMTELLAADVERLTQLLVKVCERHPHHRDYTRAELRAALRELIAGLAVYRTYADPDTGVVRQDDVMRIRSAQAAALQRRPDLDAALFEFLAGLLLLEHEGGPERDFVLRFQQTTGPVTAKAVEDTVFYRYVRFVAVNEVGGDPGRFGISTSAFHTRMQAARPYSMLATSTHDTKRSEDVRARLSLLSEIPEAWREHVVRWRKMGERHREDGLPDPHAEYLLLQTLVGAHPLSAERAVAYMEKATKEAKRLTSWTVPDQDYDDALRRFVHALLDDAEFTADLDAFVAPLIEPGRVNSLAQTLLKLTCPGVADIYQGTESWDLSLVDPDNRRPVDFEVRRRLLEAAVATTPEEALGRADEGLPKMLVIARALALRRDDPDAFTEGTYEPIAAEGPGAEHVVAFRRAGRIACVVPRLVLGRPENWRGTRIRLGDGEWANVLTDEVSPGNTTAGELLERFPVALLQRR
jgi:(1->4)-alpha-D-glucan 1-alpha-D-glucosylmutase